MEENMTPEQAIAQIEKRIAEKTTGFVKSEELNTLKNDLDAIKESTEKSTTDNTEIKSAIANIEGLIDGLKEDVQVKKSKYSSLGDAISSSYVENIDEIKSISEKGGLLNLDVKAADTMTIVGNYSGGTVGLSDLEPGVTNIQRRRPFMRSLVNSRGTTSKYIVWIEQANADPGEAGMTAEGALKTQTDFDLVERSTEVKKVTAFIKVSKEMIADIPFMQGEINGELMELVELKLDSQILYGDGTGNNLSGVNQTALTFGAGSFATSIPNANEIDVLRVTISQIINDNFSPNYILLNPTDCAKMELNKATDGTYVFPMFFQQDGMAKVKGIPVVENPGINEGEFLVGDFTKANLRIREAMNVQVGYVNDDFTKNLMTVLCECRAAMFVKTNHYAAFVKGDFATAIAAIDKP